MRIALVAADRNARDAQTISGAKGEVRAAADCLAPKRPAASTRMPARILGRERTAARFGLRLDRARRRFYAGGNEHHQSRRRLADHPGTTRAAERDRGGVLPFDPQL